LHKIQGISELSEGVFIISSRTLLHLAAVTRQTRALGKLLYVSEMSKPNHISKCMSMGYGNMSELKFFLSSPIFKCEYSVWKVIEFL
jgi:hypothetical protein